MVLPLCNPLQGGLVKSLHLPSASIGMVACILSNSSQLTSFTHQLEILAATEILFSAWVHYFCTKDTGVRLGMSGKQAAEKELRGQGQGTLCRAKNWLIPQVVPSC